MTAVGLVLIAAGLTGCHPAAPAPRAAVRVVSQVVHAEGAGDDPALRFPVEVAARYSTALSFRVSGLLVRRNVRLGDAVRKGDVLGELDTADADHQSAGAHSAMSAAEHRLLFATQQVNRDRAQYAEHLIAQSQLEASEDAYSAAAAARAQAAEQWAVARNARAYHELIADHDGVITSENADTGQVVTAGQPVFGLAWSGDVDATFDAAADDLGGLVPGQTAAVTLAALPGRRIAARVREIAPAADPQSRTYRVKLTLTSAGPEARLGMTGEAVLGSRPAAAGEAGVAAPGAATAPAGAVMAGAVTAGAVTAGAVTEGAVQPGTFTIPATALFHRGTEPAVWIVRAADSTLELRPVELVRYTQRGVVLSRGLTDGDLLVTAGVQSVHEGERVQPVAPLFPDAPAAAGLAAAAVTP